MAATVEGLVPYSLNQTQSAMVVAVVMGAWVASENRAGRLPLNVSDGRYIQNMVYNCHSRLGNSNALATDIIEHLTEEGAITPMAD